MKSSRIIDLSTWVTINAVLTSPPPAIVAKPILSFSITETSANGLHWCHWSGTASDDGDSPRVLTVVRNQNAKGLRIRLACGDLVENAWLSFLDQAASRFTRSVFEIMELEPGLVQAQFYMPNSPGATTSIGLMLLEADEQTKYAGCGRSVVVERLSLSYLKPPSVQKSGPFHSRYSTHGRQAYALCRGKGLEIGALHKPFDLDASVTYLDRYRTVELIAAYKDDPRVDSVVQVQIAWPSHKYPFLDDNAFDFVISSHVLEHVPNPGRQLEEWLRVTRPGGIVYLVVPDKNFCFDRRREVTPISHLIAEYDSDVQVTTLDHYEDFILGTHEEDNIHRDISEAYIRRCFERQTSIHVHTFTAKSLRELLLILAERCGFALEYYEAQDLHLHCALRKL